MLVGPLDGDDGSSVVVETAHVVTAPVVVLGVKQSVHNGIVTGGERESECQQGLVSLSPKNVLWREGRGGVKRTSHNHLTCLHCHALCWLHRDDRSTL